VWVSGAGRAVQQHAPLEVLAESQQVLGDLRRPDDVHFDGVEHPVGQYHVGAGERGAEQERHQLVALVLGDVERQHLAAEGVVLAAQAVERVARRSGRGPVGGLCPVIALLRKELRVASGTWALTPPAGTCGHGSPGRRRTTRPADFSAKPTRPPSSTGLGPVRSAGDPKIGLSSTSTQPRRRGHHQRSQPTVTVHERRQHRSDERTGGQVDDHRKGQVEGD